MAGNGGAAKRSLISRGDDHEDAALGSIIESCFHGSLAFRGGLSERSAHIYHMGARVNTIQDGLAEFFRVCRRHLALPRRFGKDRPN